jgi:iron complex outermembrane receptor protein
MRRNHRYGSVGARAGAQLVAAALACASALSWADQQPAQPTAEAAPTGALQEVVVTATRREQSLSKVPISVIALTEEGLDQRGIKDFADVARFTPGVNFDTSGTNNISIRGISGTGGAGTTGIYLDDTPIQMRALAFNPDEALPKSFDIARVEVLRGPQGTLFGAGSEGGTVRYITTAPSLTKTSIYSRAELSTTKGGDQSYEAGVAVGGPLVEGSVGARLTLWYRHDGGWIDDINPVTLAPVQQNANYANNYLARLAVLWAPNANWQITPAVYYQNSRRNDINNFWPLYSNPGSDNFVNADPSQRHVPDRFTLSSLKIQGDLGAAQLISNTSYYDRRNQDGYEGTIYNLGFYQLYAYLPDPVTGIYPTGASYPLIDGNGLHLPAGATDYVSPSSVDNGQQNFTQEIRLQSSDPSARLVWTTGVFLSENRQTYLEQIHDPLLSEFQNALIGDPNIVDVFGVGYDPAFPNDSYFLQTHAKDEQYAVFGEVTYGLTEKLHLTGGARFSRNKYSFDSFTGGPQLFGPSTTGSGNNSENSFTPKLSVQYQADPNDMFYTTYAKGYRPGGANNPLPFAACSQDFMNFGIPNAPTTYGSDTVDSYEIGAKNNINNRVRIASSLYYINWNNIQQTVVPPICQISFIANLGKAVAKGIDLELDASITDELTLELAAGYTSARYTQDSRLSPSEAIPVVANGDAIVGQSSETGAGQPTAPVTVAAGLEYRFNFLTHESFVRFDYEYQGRAKWPSAAQDGNAATQVGNTLQFDPANYQLAGTSFSSLRAGMQFGPWSVAAFCDNLSNTHALTDFNWSINPGDGNTRLEREYTFRPRTIGVTVIFRQ